MAGSQHIMPMLHNPALTSYVTIHTHSESYIICKHAKYLQLPIYLHFRSSVRIEILFVRAINRVHIHIIKICALVIELHFIAKKSKCVKIIAIKTGRYYHDMRYIQLKNLMPSHIFLS